MSKAAELAALIGSQTALSNRNLIINGEFQIFQRATSATNPGGGYDTADRWRSSQNSGGLGNYNAEQSTDTPNGFGFSYKLTKSGVETQNSGNSAYLQQYIEGQNVQHLNYGSSSAKKVTASFHVKSSVTGTYGVRLGDGEAGKHNVQTFTISSADTWEKKVVTFNGDTATALANDNSAEFDFAIVLGAGSNYQTSSTNTWASGNKLSTSSQTQWTETDGATFYITGVQLEVGEQATPFEHRSFGDELQRCQRYFQTYVNPMLDGIVPNNASRVYDAGLILHPEMRSAPAASISNTGSSNGQGINDGETTAYVTSLLSQGATQYGVELNFNVSTDLANYRPASFTGGGSTSNQTTYNFDAEL